MTEVPTVGTGATLCYPSDRYPLVVVATTEKTLTLEALTLVGFNTGHRPVSDVGLPTWSHQYTDEELVTMRTGRTIKASLRKNGRYYKVGTLVPVVVGSAHHYRNYAD